MVTLMKTNVSAINRIIIFCSAIKCIRLLRGMMAVARPLESRPTKKLKVDL